MNEAFTRGQGREFEQSPGRERNRGAQIPFSWSFAAIRCRIPFEDVGNAAALFATMRAALIPLAFPDTPPRERRGSLYGMDPASGALTLLAVGIDGTGTAGWYPLDVPFNYSFIAVKTASLPGAPRGRELIVQKARNVFGIAFFGPAPLNGLAPNSIRPICLWDKATSVVSAGPQFHLEETDSFTACYDPAEGGLVEQPAGAASGRILLSKKIEWLPPLPKPIIFEDIAKQDPALGNVFNNCYILRTFSTKILPEDFDPAWIYPNLTLTPPPCCDLH